MGERGESQYGRPRNGDEMGEEKEKRDGPSQPFIDVRHGF